MRPRSEGGIKESCGKLDGLAKRAGMAAATSQGARDVHKIEAATRVASDFLAWMKGREEVRCMEYLA
jgi:hypothetical protein